MTAWIFICAFMALLLSGMCLAVKRRDGKISLRRIVLFEGGVPNYWYAEMRRVRGKIGDRPDLLLLGAAFVVFALALLIPAIATIVRHLSK